MKPYVLWGATGQARVLRDAISAQEFILSAIFDSRVLPSPFSGVPMFTGKEGFQSWCSSLRSDRETFFSVAVGGNRGSERLALQEWLITEGLTPLTVIHNRSYVASSASVGQGSQILAMAAVCANAQIGRGVIVNTGASVDHDCELGDGVHVAPGARIAGEVKIGPHAFVGTGAVVLPRISIGADAVIGAGAVVIRDIAPGITVVGNPAKQIHT